MKHRNDSSRRRRKGAQRRGATIVLVVLLLVVFVGMAAFSVEVGRMCLLRTETQNAVDAGAIAANLRLRQNPQDIATAAATARDFVRRNRVGSNLQIPEDAIEVEIGTWNIKERHFVATNVKPNAVRVAARQKDEPLFFGRVFGQTNFGMPAAAIASGVSQPLDIMMVLDLSGSMFDYGRIEALQAAAPVFVDVIERLGGDDWIGVMGLSAPPLTYDPVAAGHTGRLYNSGLHPSPDCHVGVLESVLTHDYSSLRLRTLNSHNLIAEKYGGGTGTGAALGDAVHYLVHGAESRPDVKKSIVLMSDGYANKPEDNGTAYAQKMARYAAQNNVEVYTISLGNDADVDLMQSLATIANGKHFDARGSGARQLTERLTQAFTEAAWAIKRSQLVQ